MMNKRFSLLVISAICGFAVWAGGLMTNTNYHIAFDRMMARGATSDIDAAYSNPAGVAWGHEGWAVSFNWQMPHQDRDITTTFPLFTEEDHTHKFHGKASAPFVPGLFATYKHKQWAVSTMIGIVGSGGYVKYDEGVPMFIAPLMAMFAANGIMPDAYDIDASMKGKQYIYGAQVCGTYRIGKHWSVAAGVRASYYDGYYRGHVKSTLKANSMPLENIELDCDQHTLGFCPILGLNYHWRGLTLAAKYEFRTKLNPKNKTNKLVADVPEAAKEKLGGLLAQYGDGVRTRYDMPAMLSVAAGYEFGHGVRATVEYHFFDDKNAKMANDRQEALTHGTHEIVAGVEWDINRMFTVSCGAQRTDYGLSDAYQTNTSFACDSYSVGLGGAFNVNSHLRFNLGYFWTMYSDYTKEVPAANPGGYSGTTLYGKDVYSRTNRVLGIGVDYKF